MIKELSIIIPTFNNRHDYLKRSIAYHSSIGPMIYIVDSSPKPFYDNDHPAQPNIRYFHVPEMAYTEKLLFVLKKITTPYTLLLADDDFITGQGMQACLDFLEKNKDYASAQGQQISFRIKNRKIESLPLMQHLFGFEINDDSAANRIKKLFSQHIYFHYSVSRTENIFQVYSLTSTFKDDFIGGLIEYFLNSITIINGKHKVLPVFYSAREFFETSAINLYLTPDQLKNSEKYHKQYTNCLDILSTYLSEKGNCSPEKAKEVIEYAFHSSPYFSSVSKPAISDEIVYPLHSYPFLKKVIDRIPFSTDLKKQYSKILEKYTRYRAKLLLKRSITEIKEKKLPGYPYSDKEALSEWNKIKKVILAQKMVQ
jgi:glycosyltransferase domain-containing protein